MSIAIIIQARMSSNRLPGKVLTKVKGLSLLDYLLYRINNLNLSLPIFIATSNDCSDNPIVKYCIDNKIKYYRGDLSDVASRYKGIIQLYNYKYFLRLSADSPLIDPEIIKEHIIKYRITNYDIVTNVFERTYPKGQSVEIVNSNLFINNYKYMNNYHKEHVTTYFYSKPDMFKIFNISINPPLNSFNMAIDTEYDFNKFVKLINKVGDSWMDMDFKNLLSYIE